MQDVAVIEDPAAAEATLDPIRSRLLAELATPGSATTLAGKIGLPRQKVNYHLRTLEQHGLVHLVEERRKGNVTERMMQATAASYVISPAALPAVAPDTGRGADRLSAQWLLALASRLIRDVGTLLTGATQTRRRLATYALDAEIRFTGPADRAAFAEELSTTITQLAAKYHGENGRKHRLILAIHPATDSQTQPESQD
jgi:DNA-binding transcriptional ArsR family regulator